MWYMYPFINANVFTRHWTQIIPKHICLVELHRLGLERLFHFKIIIPYTYETYSNSFKTLNFSSGFNKETTIDYHSILNETITFKLSLADR